MHYEIAKLNSGKILSSEKFYQISVSMKLT